MESNTRTQTVNREIYAVPPSDPAFDIVVVMTRTDRVVFWDFDGTLARRENLWSGALLDAWRRVDDQTSGTVEQLRPHLGSGFPWHDADAVRSPQSAAEWWAALHPMFVEAFTALGLDAPRAEEASSRVPAEFYRRDAWTVIDGAEAALAVTKAAGYRNIILSNHAPELPALVESLGLAVLVEQTLTSAAVGAEKPNPAIFEFAMDRAGVTANSDVWMIGDNPVADVEGARNVGIRAILADGAYPDSVGVTVLEAARYVVAFADGAVPFDPDLEQVRTRSNHTAKTAELDAIIARRRRQATVDNRSTADILGYDEHGLPSRATDADWDDVLEKRVTGAIEETARLVDGPESIARVRTELAKRRT